MSWLFSFCIDPCLLIALIPIKIYPDADLQKKQITLENKAKSGIYRWTNKENGNFYVGSSTNLGRRFRNYFDKSCLKRELKKGNSIINNSLLKNDYSNFSLEILEYCEPSNCLEREQYYIDLLKPKYNLSLTARAPMTGRNHSELTKIKISVAQTGEGNSFYGKIHNEETLKKWSEDRKGCPRPEGSGRPSQKIEVFDLTTDIKTTYDSISDAARALGEKISGISMYLNRNTDNPFKGRYIIKKIHI
jgi:hypothetical protein